MLKKTFPGSVKRRARKLLVELITADDTKHGSLGARQRRWEAATGLVEIIRNEHNGEEAVARRFVKRASRLDEGTRALVRLSDDELEKHGYKAINPVSDVIVSAKLLDTLMEYTKSAPFFKTTISAVLGDGKNGVAAILHLATTERRRFFKNIDDWVIFNYCKRIIETEEPLCPKWYGAVKLLCKLLIHPDRAEWKYQKLLPPLLSAVCKSLIQGLVANLQAGASAKSQNDSTSLLLPPIAFCCERLEISPEWDALPAPSTLQPFIELLISLSRPQDTSTRILKARRGLALDTLVSLLRFPSAMDLLHETEAVSLSTFLADIVFHPWSLDTQDADSFERVRETRLITHATHFFTPL